MQNYLSDEAVFRSVTTPSSRRQVVEETYVVLRRIMSDMFGRMKTGLAKQGLTPQQMFLLRIMMKKGKPETPKELAQRLGVTPGNITGLVTKLEKAGFVTRAHDSRDRRSVVVKPTAKAKRDVEAMHTAVVESLMGAFETWSTLDIRKLAALLDRLATKQRDEKID